MIFPKQKMTEKELQSSKLYKDIEKHLKAIPIVGVNDNEQRTYRTPSTGKQANIYDIIFEFGTLQFFVEKGGNVSRVVIDTPQEGDRVIETLGRGDSELELTTAQLAREVLRTIRKEQSAESKVKVDKRQMDKLLETIDSEDDAETDMLQTVKNNLTKGSGKFIVVDGANKILSRNGMYTETKYAIKFFDSIEDARQEKNPNDKIVRI